MPQHLFMDLDHTLWDFEANAADTLRELYELHGLDRFCPYSADHFIELYGQINARMWSEYRAGGRSKESLRTERFNETFAAMNVPASEVPNDLWNQYLLICPTKTRLIPGARDILDYLSGSYRLHLITNGFSETQRRKLQHSHLEGYFETLTISEEVGWKKPQPEIFAHALRAAGASGSTGTYIGDSLEADVHGGLNAGWAVYWLQREPSVDLKHPKLTKIHKLADLQLHL